MPTTVADARRWLIAAVAVAVAVVVLTAGAALLFGDGPGQPTAPAPPASVPSDPPPGPSTPPPSAAPHERGARPVHVRIDAAAVDADVVPVELQGSVLAAPSDVLLAGWWSAGAKPGSDRGTVLLVGHSVHVGRGVFDRLGRLEAGDRVVVTTAGPTTVTYGVHDVRDYRPEEFAAVAPELLAQDTAPRLVLATCGDYQQGHYAATTVVKATPVD